MGLSLMGLSLMAGINSGETPLPLCHFVTLPLCHFATLHFAGW
jgi:hypothetical protein